MKFSINRNQFIEQLNHVQLAISAHTAIQILSGIKLEVTQSGLILTGSNADISIEAFIEENEDTGLNIESTGGAVINPARMLIDIIKKLPDERVSIELLENHQLSIESDTSSFVINSVDVTQYPNIAEVDDSKKIILPAQTFKEVVRQTVFAVSNHESRPILTGVKFDLSGSQFSAVSTDSRRLAQRVIELDYDNTGDYSFVIPGKSLTDLSRIISDDIEDLELYVSDSLVLFALPQLNFYSRLLEGNYPNTDHLIPDSSTTQLVLNANELKAAVDRASLLSHAGKNNVIKMKIDESGVEIFGDFPGVGQIQEDISYLYKEGENIDISFNPDFMKEALNAFGSVDVVIELLGTLRPFIIKPKDSSDEFIQLITPIRTPN